MSTNIGTLADLATNQAYAQTSNPSGYTTVSASWTNNRGQTTISDVGMVI